MIELDKKYSTIISSDARYHVVIGGRSSGKSFAMTTIMSLMLLEPDTKILFLRKTLTSAHLSIIPEFLEKLEMIGIEDEFNITKTEIFHKNNGSCIYFRGIQSSSSDNTANLKSINGVSIVCFDEMEELTDESTFDKIDYSVRKKDKINKVICIMNPTTKEHFIYNRFYSSVGVSDNFNGIKENVNYIHTTYLDNINNINESFIEQANLLKVRNPEKYKHVLLGAWLPKAEGVIFDNWTLGDFKHNDNMIWGCDWGFSIDPTTLIHISIDKAQKKIWLKEECYKAKMTTDDIAELMLHRCGSDLVIADSAEPRLIDELNKKGLNVLPAAKGPGSIREGIALLLNYEIIIDYSSLNLIKEANNYAWNDKKSETPIDAWNHCWDSVRYGVTYALTQVERVHEFGW